MSSVRRRSHRSQSGFSLAEVFVATAIFAVIFIAALLVYDRSNKVFKAGVEAADLQQNTRVAFDKLLADPRLAGFDFDRDGMPTAAGQAQQPDEQIEYAGRSAITIRGNFNYNAAEHGRRHGAGAAGRPARSFPIVTTGNDEIVTYALVPDSPSAVTENLVFYADVTDGTRRQTAELSRRQHRGHHHHHRASTCAMTTRTATASSGAINLPIRCIDSL